MSKKFLNAFGGKISTACKDPVKLKTLVKEIEQYFDKFSSVVFDSGPGKPLLFPTSNKDFILNFVGVTEKEVHDVVLQIPSIKANWKKLNDPYILLSIFVIRELEILKKERERDLVLMLISMNTFSGRQKKSFPLGTNEQIMAYTMNNLSGKFKYKSLVNNYNMVKDVVTISHNTYRQQLIKGDDEVLNIYFSQMHTRISKIINTVAEEYYRNRDSKKYLNTVKSHDDEIGERDNVNSNALIEDLARTTMDAFVAVNVSLPLVRSIATKNNIPYVALYQCLLEVRKSESSESLLTMFRSMVQSLYETDNSILARVCSKDFLVKALKQLSISNSSSQSLATLKSCLDKMLDTHCIKYAETQRLATKMAYRNALYTYFVFILITKKCG